MLCFVPSHTAGTLARFVLHLPDSSLVANSAPITASGCIRSRGAHTGMPATGLSSPPCTGMGTVAPQAPAWAGAVVEQDGSLWQLSCVVPPDLPCPHTNLTSGVLALTGCLCRQSLQAEPPRGSPVRARSPHCTGKGVAVSPGQRPKPPAPPPPCQRCRIKFLQYFTEGRTPGQALRKIIPSLLFWTVKVLPQGSESWLN